MIRSLRHGRRKALKKGQELLVNYNIPHYSPLDWFVSMGFVPPERQGSWQKMSAALPRVRQDLEGVETKEDNKDTSNSKTTTSKFRLNQPTIELWEKERGPQVQAQWKEIQKKRKQQKQQQRAQLSAAAAASKNSSTGAPQESGRAKANVKAKSR